MTWKPKASTKVVIELDFDGHCKDDNALKQCVFDYLCQLIDDDDLYYETYLYGVDNDNEPMLRLVDNEDNTNT